MTFLLRFCITLALALPLAVTAQATEPRFQQPWPDNPEIEGERVTLRSGNPFTLRDVPSDDPIDLRVRLFMPPNASADAPVPAVVLLHGAGGVRWSRELTYGPQFAEQGVAAVVVDSFAPRRDLASGFLDRLFNITEVMMATDAYRVLDYLNSRPDIDGARVAVIGFSYGGMVSILSAYEQVRAALAEGEQRFAAHIAFYGPCIIRAEDPTTTGAPVLMLNGGRDNILDPEACEALAADLSDSGSEVELVVYPEAMHLWDGSRSTPWRPRFTLRYCDFRLDADGSSRDASTGVPIGTPFLRKAALGLCASDEGYLIGADPAVRQLSNAKMAAFLSEAFSTVQE